MLTACELHELKHKWNSQNITCANNDAVEMEFDSFDGGDVDEHNAVGFVKLY